MKYILALICVVALLVCSSTNYARSGPVRCDAPTSGIPKARILLFGEMHGSVESPVLVSKVVCALAQNGPVALGLELPSTEQAPIDRYLASNGGAAALEALRSGQFWQHGDGRSSVAMFNLIDAARRLKQSGLAVSVFTLDPDLAGTADDNKALARALRMYHDQHPVSRIVSLMGNLHAGQAVVSPFGEPITPAGFYLHDLHPVSVYMTYHSGTIWACMGTCGVHKVSSRWAPDNGPGFTSDAPMEGYSVSYMLPSLTASPPAGGAVKKYIRVGRE